MFLSDRQIKERCMKPTHFLQDGGGKGTYSPVIPGVTHPVEVVENWEVRSYSRLMKATDRAIQDLNWKPMISPFVDHAVRYKDDGTKIISYGLSSAGYDIRMAKQGIKIFTNINSTIIDPMRMSPSAYSDAEVRFDEEFGLHYFVLPPKTVALGHTMEIFNVPRDIIITCLGKSTYARVAMMPIVTPLEPEWEGQLVLEVANLVELPTRVYLECGIAQLLFGQMSEPCQVSYKDKGGKYQGQTGTQDALV